ncbi:plasmid stabilization protein [Candidatus Parcubacteria bacterium]|nr:MAG: plasmid stabilization protein [Candidatus Parcubacteria bacterium]
MAALTIRNIDEKLKQALRLQAAEHGISMEEEVRRILRQAVMTAQATQSLPLGQRLKQRFEEIADAQFELPERHPPRTPPAWEGEDAQ